MTFKVQFQVLDRARHVSNYKVRHDIHNVRRGGGSITEAVDRLLDSTYDEEDEDFQLTRAERYFAIGHHNARTEWDSSDGPAPDKDYCWMWDGSLRVSQENSHAIAFGHVGRFKGWYDTASGTLSFTDSRDRVRTEDDIPAQVHKHLVRRFKPKRIVVF